jgi:hypothetical protein
LNHRRKEIMMARNELTPRSQCKILKRRDGFKSMLPGFSWFGPTGKRLLV